MQIQNRPARKILIMSYLFPPVGGIGVQRALSLAKYLPPCGFEVHVLKANTPEDRCTTLNWSVRSRPA
jgi:hypothetical protein